MRSATIFRTICVLMSFGIRQNCSTVSTPFQFRQITRKKKQTESCNLHKYAMRKCFKMFSRSYRNECKLFSSFRRKFSLWFQFFASEQRMIGPDENEINTLRMQNAWHTNCARSSLNSFRGNWFKNVFYLYWPQRRATECSSFDFCIHEFTFREFFCFFQFSICVLNTSSFRSFRLH